MPNTDFYAKLPAITRFSDITNIEKYTQVPNGWHIIITDIKGSTNAIEEGRYKDVNTIGASSIIAVLNAVQKIDIPFVFGGDGATMIVPEEVLTATKSALLATKQLAQEMFKLELRAGIVPIETITQKGFDVKIAKFRASPNYHQAMFTGTGLSYAEKLVKDPTAHYELVMDVPSKASYDGLECRWQDIYSQHGETVSLIIKATTGSPKTDSIVYRTAIEHIRKIYGTEEDFHPVAENQLHLTIKGKQLDSEVKVKAWQKSKLGKTLYRIYLQIVCFLSSLLMKSNITTNDLNFKLYKKILIETTDYKKFDDALRLVMAGTAEQRKKLVSELQKSHKKGELAYGIHVSDRALMTCLVFERYGKQVHFVDGADGGYARAAKEMKAQLKASIPSSNSQENA